MNSTDEGIDLSDADTGDDLLRVVDVEDGFIFRTALPPGTKLAGDPVAEHVTTTITPAGAVLLVVFLQHKLGLIEGMRPAKDLLGPYDKCPKCKMWIHRRTPVAHNCP